MLFIDRKPNTARLRPSKQGQRSAQSVVLLALWTLFVGAAFIGTLFNMRESWSLLFLFGSVLFLAALWFSLQWDLLQHYLPQVPVDIWTLQSISGFALGVVVGGFVGVCGAISALQVPRSIGSFELSGSLMLGAAGVGLLVGFVMLGWRQTAVLNPYIEGVWWWVAAMTIAWMPVPLAWLSYEALLQGLVVNIYPEAHLVVKVLAAEVALLCPSLAMFAVIVRRGNAPPSTPDRVNTVQISQARPHQRPTGLLVGLLSPPLIVAVAFGILLVRQGLRVERAWLAKDGPAAYLRVGRDGSVGTLPGSNEKWDPNYKLWDSSPDDSMKVGVEGSREESRVVISSTNIGGVGPQPPPTIIRTIEVFSTPPKNRYSGDIINVVHFSPDGALLAVGTGQTSEVDDSSMSRSNDHAVHLWSLHDSSVHYILSDPVYTVRAIAWSPDSQFLAAAGGLDNSDVFKGDNLIRVWRVATQQAGKSVPPSLEFTLIGHTSTVEALTWNTNNRLVSRDLSGRVVIWKIP